jgi:integrase
MSPTKRGGIFYIYVPLQSGGVRLRTTGTKDAGVYRGMKRMVAQLKDARRWKLLTAVHSGRLTLGDLYDAHAANALDALEASLSASKLDAHTAAYLASLRSLGRSVRYVEGVSTKLTAFTASAGQTTADLTPRVVTEWLSSLHTTPGTRRQYLYAVTGFARYLVRIGILASYPLGAVEAPKKNPARKRWETEANDRRIVDAASPKYRALFAFIHATGCDVSTAFRTRRRDIDLDRARVRLQGTKTAHRDVDEAIVEAWAIPFLTAHCGALTANALLWPQGAGKPGKHGRTETATYSVAGAGKHHDKCCAALELEDYTLKDARHSVAVRMRFAGYDYEQIAGQLGNSAYQVAKVYARFTPTLDRKTGSV